MGKFTGRNKLMAVLIGEAVERLACRFGDDMGTYNTLSKCDAEQLLDMVKACKVGNLYSRHNLECIWGLFSEGCIDGRIDSDAMDIANDVKHTCEAYLSRINVKVGGAK